jgi:hypothetical protein
MAVALSLGWIVSRTLLTVLFFVVITPLAGVTRLFGSRFLETQRDPAAVSYWTKRVRGKTEYEKMS